MNTLKKIPVIQGDYYQCIRECEQRFSGQSYFKFYFYYTASNSQFNELKRFIWESRQMESARFKNEYSGNAVVNITDWVKNSYDLNQYFDALIYYLLDKEINACLITSIKCRESIISYLNSFPLEAEHIILFEDNRNPDNQKRKIGFER